MRKGRPWRSAGKATVRKMPSRRRGKAPQACGTGVCHRSVRTCPDFSTFGNFSDNFLYVQDDFFDGAPAVSGRERGKRLFSTSGSKNNRPLLLSVLPIAGYNRKNLYGTASASCPASRTPPSGKGVGQTRRCTMERRRFLYSALAAASLAAIPAARSSAAAATTARREGSAPMTPSQRQNPMSCNGMVTSPHYLASQAGLDILRPPPWPWSIRRCAHWAATISGSSMMPARAR